MFFNIVFLFCFLAIKISVQNDLETTELLKSEVEYLREENENKESRISSLEVDNALFKKLWRQGHKEIEDIRKAMYQQCTKGNLSIIILLNLWQNHFLKLKNYIRISGLSLGDDRRATCHFQPSTGNC